MTAAAIPFDLSKYSPQELATLHAKMCKLRAAQAEISLFHFYRDYVWPAVEGLRPFVDNWHLHAVAEHLEAVTSGEIRRLVVNVPFRTSKSTLVSVAWPAWVWLKAPAFQWLCGSYAEKLAVRDSLKMRRLFQSPRFSTDFSGKVEMTADQNQKTRFENTAGGYRIAFGMTGGIMGDGGDCFSNYTLVNTESGFIPIGQLVREAKPIRVWSFDPATGATVLKRVTKFYTCAASDIVKVTMSDGSSLQCTPNHKVWTLRGWVAAAALRDSDMLPCTAAPYLRDNAFTNSKLYSHVVIGQRRLKNFLDQGLSKLGVWLGHAKQLGSNALGLVDFDRPLRQSLCQVAPAALAPNASNLRLANRVTVSQHRAGLCGCVDSDNVGLSEFSTGAVGSIRASLVLYRVRHIDCVSRVFKIGQCGVQRVAIKVSDFVSRWTRAEESQGHDSMNQQASESVIGSYAKTWITFAQWCRDKALFLVGKNSRAIFGQAPADLPSQAFDTTDGRDQVVGVTRYRSPRFIETVSHESVTFCLDVEDTHTFLVGPSNIIVHNCVIIDDPHDRQGANSEAERETALTTYDEAVVTRLNTPETDPIVIIMQRLHQNDLSGHVLKQKGWTHLMLPMRFEAARRCVTALGFRDPRTKEGELLWPKRFPEKTVTELEASLGSYGSAGQLQQRPAPAGGGILKADRFRLWPATKPLPDLFFILQSYDTAFTEKTTGDPSACTVWGVFEHEKRRNVILLDSWAEHLSYPDLKEKVMDDWGARYGGIKNDSLHPSRKADVILVEAKGSGQSLLQDLHRANVPVQGYNPGKADKMARAHMASPLLESDTWWVLESGNDRGRPRTWARPFLLQAESFPNGEHDDLVDTFTQAAIYLRDAGQLEAKVVPVDEPEDAEYGNVTRGNPYAK